MKKTSVIRNGFYKKYIDDQKPVTQPIEITHEKVIVVNQKEKDGLIKVLFSTIGAVIRAICYVLLFLLSSIGLTVIINQSIRAIIIQMLIS